MVEEQCPDTPQLHTDPNGTLRTRITIQWRSHSEKVTNPSYVPFNLSAPATKASDTTIPNSYLAGVSVIFTVPLVTDQKYGWYGCVLGVSMFIQSLVTKYGMESFRTSDLGLNTPGKLELFLK